MEDEKIQNWQKSWEIVNSQLPNGVNPSAYRLGWLDAKSIIKGLHKGESNDLMDKGWNEAIEHITKNIL